MDLMYLPDAITYPALRSSTAPNLYEPEDAPLWIKSGQGRPQQQQKHEKRDPAHSGPCPLCKERQKRRLATYIRTKSRQDSECAIEEEEEEKQEKKDSKN